MQTVVMHGKNSGAAMATSFSNANNSNKSVLYNATQHGTKFDRLVKPQVIICKFDWMILKDEYA
jgi:hypothetical protein